MRAILMFHNCKGQSHKTVSTDHNFWREMRAGADSNRGSSAYHPNALPLGQTGSLSACHILVHLFHSPSQPGEQDSFRATIRNSAADKLKNCKTE